MTAGSENVYMLVVVDPAISETSNRSRETVG
jgi:hypothetical protein